MSLSDDEVFRDYFEEEKKDPRNRGRKSTELFLTMNLNERLSTMTAEEKRDFKAFAETLFGPKRKILTYFTDKKSVDDPSRNILDVKIRWKPEVGPKTGKLHLHALVSIEHDGFFT